MRGRAFGRQLKLLQLLESRAGGVELEEVAGELRIGRRTVYRDFRVLEDAGYPLAVEHEGPRARWKLMDGYRHRMPLALTATELWALGGAAQLTLPLTGTVFRTSVESALEKVRAALPRPSAELLNGARGAVSAAEGAREYSTRGKLLAPIIEAISRRVSLVVRYRSRAGSATGERRLDPYHLHVANAGVYLLAKCHRTGKVKTFLLDRFETVASTDEHFEPDPEFNPARLVRTAFQMWSGEPQIVRFVAHGASVALLAERKLHSTQQFQLRSDGSAEVQLSVPFSPPLVAYLCAMGAEISDLEPTSLRRAVVERLQRAIAALKT